MTRLFTPLSGNQTPSPSAASAVAWILYDFAYSIFAFVVFARYLSTWLINDLDKPDIYYSGTQVITALSLVILMPLAGALADRVGRHIPFLAMFSLLASIAAIALGVMPTDQSVIPLLIAGAVCAAATGLAFAQFDPLLAVVASPAQWGKVSGVAVAAGYVGIAISIPVWGELIVKDGSKQSAFIPASLVMLLATLPLVLIVRERGAAPSDPAELQEPRIRPFHQLKESVATARQTPGVVRLLSARFLYADAVGTLNIYMIVYISRLGDFTERQKNIAVALGVLFAGIGAAVAGWQSSRRGPRVVLLTILPLLSATLVFIAFIGEAWTVWLMAPTVGTALGTVYAADRVFMLRLTPTAVRGQLFGIFNVIGRAAQALGPFLLWGSVIWVLHTRTGWLSELDASRVSICLLALSVIAGAAILRPLSDKPRSISS